MDKRNSIFQEIMEEEHLPDHANSSRLYDRSYSELTDTQEHEATY